MSDTRNFRIGLAAIVAIGVFSFFMIALRMQSWPLAIVLMAANLGVCAWMIRSGHLKWFWWLYAAGCLLTVALAGMTSPLELIFVLLFWRVL